MKQIEFKSALFGQPGIVCQTLSGKKVVELHYFKELNSDWPIFAVLENDDILRNYSVGGIFFRDRDKNFDLVMFEQEDIAFLVISKAHDGIFEVYHYSRRSSIEEWLDSHQDSLVLNILEIEKATGKILKQRNF